MAAQAMQLLERSDVLAALVGLVERAPCAIVSLAAIPELPASPVRRRTRALPRGGGTCGPGPEPRRSVRCPARHSEGSAPPTV